MTTKKPTKKKLGLLALALTLATLELSPLTALAEVRDESSLSSAVQGTSKTYHRTVATNYHAGNILGMVSTSTAKDIAEAFGITKEQVAKGYEPVLYINSFPWASYERRLAQKAAKDFGGTVVTMVDLRLFRWDSTAFYELDNTTAPIQMIMGIPKKAHDEAGNEYVVLPENYNRDFAAIRVYKDEVTILRDLDTDPKTLTFETNKRGVIALTFAPEGSLDAYFKKLEEAKKASTVKKRRR